MRYQIISERSAGYAVKIKHPQDVVPILKRYRKQKQEVFIVITLDGAHQVICTRIVSVGLVNRTVVHPREVYAPAISDRSVAVILAHNHPSGSLEPSPEDHEVTRRMKDAGEILGITVLDHIILGKGSDYYSFQEQGQM